MLNFVTFAVKTQLNVHDLNNEAVAGNVTDIRIMEFLDEKGKKQETPAVSGRWRISRYDRFECFLKVSSPSKKRFWK